MRLRADDVGAARDFERMLQLVAEDGDLPRQREIPADPHQHVPQSRGGGQERAARRRCLRAGVRTARRRRRRCLRVDRRARETTATAARPASTTACRRGSVSRRRGCRGTGSARIGADVTSSDQDEQRSDACECERSRCAWCTASGAPDFLDAVLRSRSHFRRNSVKCGMRDERNFTQFCRMNFVLLQKRVSVGSRAHAARTRPIRGPCPAGAPAAAACGHRCGIDAPSPRKCRSLICPALKTASRPEHRHARRAASVDPARGQPGALGHAQPQGVAAAGPQHPGAASRRHPRHGHGAARRRAAGRGGGRVRGSRPVGALPGRRRHYRARWSKAASRSSCRG